MSIALLKKVTLFGAESEKEAMLLDLQSLGCVHLISLHEEAAAVVPTDPTWDESAATTVRHLAGVRRRRHQEIEAADFNMERIVEAAMKNKERQREAADRCLALKSRIAELSPWGNFKLPPLEEMGGCRLWFYRIPHNQIGKLAQLTLPWQVVARDHRFAYTIVISPDEPRPETLPVARAHVGKVPLDELKQNLQRAELEMDDLEAEQEALSRWIYLLSKNLARIEDKHALTQAIRQSRPLDGFFMVQGWLPSIHVPDLRSFADSKGVALLEEDPATDDAPPTLMENRNAFQGGQDLVNFYETPAYRTWDPSWVLTCSFAIFFAMILADAGYAVVLLILLFLIHGKLNQSAGGKRFCRMMWGVLTAAFVFGILCGGYFGVEPEPGTFLGSLHIVHLHDTDSMMKLALTVGCCHLIIANAATGIHAKKPGGKWKSTGWILVIVGGLLLYLSRGTQMQEIIGNVSYGIIAGGFLLIVAFGSSRKVDSLRSAALRLFGGLGALFEITKLFGDALSYLRLFALGLASVSLALTFNQIAGNINKSIPGFGILLGLFVLLLGHALNLFLGIVSGFVHGLRLNYIEFFNWGLAEEGYLFKPFQKKEINL